MPHNPRTVLALLLACLLLVGLAFVEHTPAGDGSSSHVSATHSH